MQLQAQSVTVTPVAVTQYRAIWLQMSQFSNLWQNSLGYSDTVYAVCLQWQFLGLPEGVTITDFLRLLKREFRVTLQRNYEIRMNDVFWSSIIRLRFSSSLKPIVLFTCLLGAKQFITRVGLKSRCNCILHNGSGLFPPFFPRGFFQILTLHLIYDTSLAV